MTDWNPSVPIVSASAGPPTSAIKANIRFHLTESGESSALRHFAKYSAPRRKSWSVVVEGERVDRDGDRVVTLYNYNAYGRTKEDVRCAPMPRPVFDLGVQLWLAAMPFLCEESRRSPPTHCQLLFYYTLFNSAMGEATCGMHIPLLP